MSWWGKVAGGAFGFAMGGPIGAIIGAVVGHQLDQGLRKAAEYDALGHAGVNQERVQTAFFTTVFSVMGHLAKADGRVSETEIQMARNFMRQMNLNEQQQKFAADLFQQGKRPDFPLEDVIDQFKNECGRNRNLKQMFIEILLHGAYADGHMHAAERHLLTRICKRLGFSQAEFAVIEGMVKAQQAFHGRAGNEAAKPRTDLLREAYQALGITKDTSDAEVKKAYRRLMNQHHPDKLVSKGLPEEMIKLANEKTSEIKAAYETIRKARGIK